MSTWIAVKQALVVLDAIERTWGRQVGLDGSGVTIFLLLAQLPGRSTSDLALLSGRQRQHVWRSMTGLKERGLVHAARVSDRGTEGWSLSPKGLVLARALEKRLAAWEALMQRSVDLDEISRSLQRMVTTVVNRPRATGWRKGLLAPEESWLDPEWNAHLESAVLPAAAPPHPETADESVDPKTDDEEFEQLAARWRAIWN